MGLIPPTERRFVPLSPDEQRNAAESARAIAKVASERRDALRPARRAVLASGHVLRDMEAAVECHCSCHPRPADPERHDGGRSCPCQQSPEERKAASAAFLALLAENSAVDDEYFTRSAAEFSIAAMRLGVEAKVVVSAAPMVISGVCDGRAFYVRERHGDWRVTIAADDQPLLDPWTSPIEDPSIDIAEGSDRDFADETGRYSQTKALEVAVDAVRAFVGRTHCEHERPVDDTHRYCRRCGVDLNDADRWTRSVRD